jgi:hypothetical protein
MFFRNRMAVEAILRGTRLGEAQSVGAMQVVPLLGEDLTDFAPPLVEVSTSSYGTVHLRNVGDRPTIVPTAAGWVIARAAQDHAIASAVVVAAGEERVVTTAMCIQQTQAGLIDRAQHNLLILPAALRAPALALRKDVGHGKLWNDIARFVESTGAPGWYGGHLAHYLAHYERELSRFVAEFEVVPGQLGALVLMNGELCGVERTPSADYWKVVWDPLIRVCYGSIAIKLAAPAPTCTRHPMRPAGSSLASIAEALERAEAAEQSAVRAVVKAAAADRLELSSEDDAFGAFSLRTAASDHLWGQVLEHRGEGVAYASLCSADC